MNQVLTKPMLLTDPLETIIKGCRENDTQCQEQLYRHCYPEVIKLCHRYAGDMDGAGIVFNNAMLRVFRSLPNYRHEGKFLNWMKTIVLNCCLDFVKRRHKFRNEPLGPAQEEEISIPEDVWDTVSAKEIQKIIQQLPGATAVVFNLFVYEGFTHKQIGATLHISEGTSRWHVSEGRKILKLKLEKISTRETKK
jgi:RNA polymerase sigma-70 factor, ECF subfamily